MYGVLLAAGTLAVYSQSWTLSFINIDDPEYASLNPHVQAGLSSQSLQWSLGGNHDCNWIPLTWLSLMLDSPNTESVLLAITSRTSSYIRPTR